MQENNNKKKVLLIGESCRDVFVGVNCRLSPESPSLVGNYIYERENAGMAANVRLNIEALSRPDDLEVLFLTNTTPIIKKRFVDDKTGHIIFRLDCHDFVKSDEKLTEGKLVEFFRNEKIKFSELAGVVISQYKNLMDKNFIHFIGSLCRTHNIPSFLDTKFILGEWSKTIDFIKINDVEYENNKKQWANPEVYATNLIVTNGVKPANWYNESGSRKNFEIIRPKKIFSSIGCGDVVLSQLAVSYLEGESIEDCINKSLIAATIKCTQENMVVNRADVELFLNNK